MVRGGSSPLGRTGKAPQRGAFLRGQKGPTQLASTSDVLVTDDRDVCRVRLLLPDAGAAVILGGCRTMSMRMGEERNAFERLFRGHHLAVHRYALRRVGERAADDVVAETFLVAWRRHEEIVGDPLPWLLGVARRVCANQLRASVRQASLGRRLAA